MGDCLKRISLRLHISARCLQRQFLGQNAYIMMQVEWFLQKKIKKLRDEEKKHYICPKYKPMHLRRSVEVKPMSTKRMRGDGIGIIK